MKARLTYRVAAAMAWVLRGSCALDLAVRADTHVAMLYAFVAVLWAMRRVRGWVVRLRRRRAMRVASLQLLQPRGADLHGDIVAAQVLEADVAGARPILDRRRIGSVVPLGGLVELRQIDVVDKLAIERGLETLPLELNADAVPFGRLVDL